jgi:DNA-binding IclR family transcriptional regulator
MRTGEDYFSKTIDKGLRVLELFDGDRQNLNLTEIARELSINLTSTYRYVNTFLQLGYLEKDPQSGSLRLGSKAFALGFIFLQRFDLLNLTRPLVDEVYRKYDISIDVALFSDCALNVIYRRDAKETLSFRLPVSTKAFYCTALGKAILAFLTPEDQRRVLETITLEKRTPRTITKRSDLQHELMKTAERGYSLNNEEYMRGLLSIGCPILNSVTKKVLGAISIDSNTIKHRCDEFEREFSPVIKELCSNISSLMSIARR